MKKWQPNGFFRRSENVNLKSSGYRPMFRDEPMNPETVGNIEKCE
jgi:hypothetical protein